MLRRPFTNGSVRDMTLREYEHYRARLLAGDRVECGPRQRMLQLEHDADFLTGRHITYEDARDCLRCQKDRSADALQRRHQLLDAPLADWRGKLAKRYAATAPTTKEGTT